MNIGRLHFVVEGKLRWCPIGSTAREGAAGIRRALAAACNDVRRLKGYGERRLGMVFAVPSLPWAQREKTHSLVAKWLEKIRIVPTDGLAWTFPRSTRRLAAENGRIYPGVVLLMREAR